MKKKEKQVNENNIQNLPSNSNSIKEKLQTYFLENDPPEDFDQLLSIVFFSFPFSFFYFKQIN